MTITSKDIFCFVERYEPEITSTLGATVSLVLIRLYFNNEGTFGQLTKAEKKKLKESNRRISRALKLSKSKVLKFRGGGSPIINPQLIAKHVSKITVNAAKDGSIHALAIIIACKLSPKTENLVRTICLGGRTDALVNEIANNLQTKRLVIIRRLIIDQEIRKHVNDLLLGLGLIKEPLSKLNLVKLSLYSISVLEIPIVKGAIIGARGIAFIFITNKIKQVIVSEMSQEITKGIIASLLTMLASSNPEPICGVDMTEIEKLKQRLLSRPNFQRSLPSDTSVVENILNPTFNDEIIDFIDIDPVVEKLIPSQLPLIQYSPKFNVNYVMERLVIGNDISKLPRDHITNLW